MSQKCFLYSRNLNEARQILISRTGTKCYHLKDIAWSKLTNILKKL